MHTDNVGNAISNELGVHTFSEWLLAMGENHLPCIDNEYVDWSQSLIIRGNGGDNEKNNGCAKPLIASMWGFGKERVWQTVTS